MNNPYGLYCCKCSSSLSSPCELSEWSLFEYIMFCHALWWIFYFFLLIVTKQSEEWCCRLLTFFHGCLISYCALRDAYVNKSRIEFKRTALSKSKKYYLSYMFSYFLFDFCWIHFFGNETRIIYFHHIASILIIFNMLARNIGSPGIDYGAAGLELTNPYLQLRWFLRSHGHQDTIFHKIVELWFLLSFSLIRVIGGSTLVYHAVLKSDLDWLTKLTFIFIYGISMILQWQIASYFRKKYLSHGNGVLFMPSRVSISLYFQRRTLDQFENNYEEENDEGQEKSVTSKELSTSKNLTASKEFIINPDCSVRRKSSVKRQSSIRRESSTKRKFSVKKEFFENEDPSAILPVKCEEPSVVLPIKCEEPSAVLPIKSEEPSAALPIKTEEPTDDFPTISERSENFQTENIEEKIKLENDNEI